MTEINSKLKLSDPDTVSDEILPEYRLDYSKARPNRFAELAAKAVENECKKQAVAEATNDERPASVTRLAEAALSAASSIKK